ncbi:MBL fold metallo-hydrolase [Pseudobdellovibrio sp. HCB154]|uniref:MBL fold metallo-hydrolase n=1 Tax=Pseudobdellovibrio sp. HCB154 TaxID=3386277 RepID=UPI003916D3E4
MPVTISRILHAGYEFKTDKAQIFFDPIFENPFSRNCYAFPEIQFDLEKIKNLKPDAVFISHHHDDHCSFESLNLLNRDIPIYMYCVHDEMFTLIRELGFKNVYPLELDKSVMVADLEVIPRRALDRDVDCLFQIKSQGLNVLNVVDSWIDEETMHLLIQNKPWDLICWPFQTMREVEVLSPHRYKATPQTLPSEWLAQLKELNPKTVIPSSCQFQMESWSWYNEAFFPISYTQFSDEVTAVLPEAQIQRLNPGKSILLNNESLTESSPLTWITPVCDQDIDYKYNLNVVPQKTEDIAKHFPALTLTEQKRVEEFCKSEILAKHQELGPSADPYFVKPRIWELSLFNNQGLKKAYFYRLEEDNLQLLTQAPAQVDWFTEVSERKLFAALELGESLTSMYLRITCENEDVDIIEDPLIRSLFSEGFASYQKAQLLKLKSKN